MPSSYIMLLILLTSPRQHPQDNTQAEDNTTTMTTPTQNLESILECLPIELRRQIYRTYMHTDFSHQSPGALTAVLRLNKRYAGEYRDEVVSQAKRKARFLAIDLAARYSELDLTVNIPGTWDEAKSLNIDVMVSAANITQPTLFRTFTEQILRECTLLHTRTLELRLVPAHPPMLIPPSTPSGAGTSRYHTPRHLIFALGQDVVVKFTGNDEVRRSGASKVVVSWGSGMDMNDEWTGLLQHLHGNVVHSLGWYGQRVPVIPQGVRQVQWWIL